MCAYTFSCCDKYESYTSCHSSLFYLLCEVWKLYIAVWKLFQKKEAWKSYSLVYKHVSLIILGMTFLHESICDIQTYFRYLSQVLTMYLGASKIFSALSKVWELYLLQLYIEVCTLEYKLVSLLNEVWKLYLTYIQICFSRWVKYGGCTFSNLFQHFQWSVKVVLILAYKPISTVECIMKV